MRRIFFTAAFIALLAAAIAPVFSQEEVESETEPAVITEYSDQLFSEYIVLETGILEKHSEGSLSSYNLSEIERLRIKAVNENRDDVVSRLDMLAFVVNEGLASQTAALSPVKVLSGIEAVETEYRRELAAKKAISSATGISIGTAIVSGTIFAVSSISSVEFYDKYTASESADQAGFYLFWWQFLEKVSFFSALTTVVSGISAGIFAAAE